MPFPRLHVIRALGLAAVLLGGTGCGGSRPPMARVSGVVRVDGKPLSTGRVTFWPSSGRSAAGWIEEDGSFVLGTFTEDDGAFVGRHRVTVTPATRTPSGPPDFDRDGTPQGWPRSPIQPRYSNPEASGLHYDIRPGSNRFEIDLDSKARG